MFHRFVDIRENILKQFWLNYNLEESEFKDKIKKYKKDYPNDSNIIGMETSIRKEIKRFN